MHIGSLAFANILHLTDKSVHLWLLALSRRSSRRSSRYIPPASWFLASLLLAWSWRIAHDGRCFVASEIQKRNLEHSSFCDYCSDPLRNFNCNAFAVYDEIFRVPSIFTYNAAVVRGSARLPLIGTLPRSFDRVRLFPGIRARVFFANQGCPGGFFLTDGSWNLVSSFDVVIQQLYKFVDDCRPG